MLLDNFIANMSGPAFLLFYLVWILVVIAITRHKVDNIEKTDSSVLISGALSEQEIAALYRGKDGLRDSLLFNLLARNILVISKNLFHKYFALNPTQYHIHISQLSALECELCEHFKTPQSMQSVSPIIDDLYQKMAMSFLHRGFIKTRSYCEKLSRLQIKANCILLGLGGYKLVVALITGHMNVLFLIIMMTIACLVQINYFSQKTGKKHNADPAHRLTNYGRAQLASIAINMRHLSLKKIYGKTKLSGVIIDMQRASSQKIQKMVAQQDFNQLFLLMLFAGGNNLPAAFSYMNTIFPAYLDEVALNKSLAIIGIHELKAGAVASGCSSGCSHSGCSSSDSSGCGSGCGGCGGD